MGHYENGRWVSDDPMQQSADANGGYLPGSRSSSPPAGSDVGKAEAFFRQWITKVAKHCGHSVVMSWPEIETIERYIARLEAEILQLKEEKNR